MKISTFAAFYRLMLERAKPQSNKTSAFRLVCERMWFDGVLVKKQLEREAGVSWATAGKWVEAAKALGVTSGQRRKRDSDPTAPAVDSTRFNVRTNDVGLDAPSPDPDTEADYAAAEYDLTTEQLRDLARKRATFDLKNARSPEQVRTATDVLGRVVPNFKAPEVSVQVQAFVGSGAADALLAAVRESMDILIENDADFVRDLLSHPSARALLPNAEASDESEAPAARPADDPNDADQS